jgi:hypothetical protein
MSDETPRVFVPQIPSRRDSESRIWVPTVNLKPAEEFGEVVTLLPPGSQFFAAKEMTRLIKQRLHDGSFREIDYLLPLGSPTAMAVTAAVAARRLNGRLNILVWDGASQSYSAYELDNLI